MDNIIQKITHQYGAEVEQVKTIGAAEIAVQLKEGVNSTEFSQKLKDNLVNIIDDLSIVKVNIVDVNDNLMDSFSSNQ